MSEKVTTLKNLKEYAKGQLVELPEFAEGQPFIARMRRPSIMVMAKSGKIPNALLSTANSMFNGSNDPDDPLPLQDMLEVMDVLCEASLIEPTFSQIKEAGIELTDEQYMAIFSYTQRGLKALDSFRPEQKQPDESLGDVATV